MNQDESLIHLQNNIDLEWDYASIDEQQPLWLQMIIME